MNHKFNREKLEEAMLTDNKKFIAEEWERCKNPRYFYNTYWQEMVHEGSYRIKRRSSILSENLIRSVEEIDRLVLKKNVR